VEQANGRNKSDQDEYRDEDSEDAQPPSTPNTVEISTRGRPRRAAAVKADLMRPVKPTRRRRVRSDSEDGGESDEPFFLNCEICKKSGWNEVRFAFAFASAALPVKLTDSQG
jgi:hypothetical protein